MTTCGCLFRLQLSIGNLSRLLILNLERTFFIRHYKGWLTKKLLLNSIDFLTIGILPSLYFVVSDSKNLCNR